MHSSDPTATAHPDALQTTGDGRSILIGLFRWWGGAWRPARARPDALAAAHARRCALESITPADVRDIGMAREDATGMPTRQPDLPFFMQSGFGSKAD
jgi:hypothetical protein